MFRAALLWTFLVVQGVFAESAELERLLEGNKRFMAQKLFHPN